MSPDIYEVYAVKYATRDGTRSGNFIGGDPHDGPMPMDYFVWLIRNPDRTFVVDVGFSEAMARRLSPRAGTVAQRGLLDQWYAFSAAADEAALRAWCEEEGLELSD